MGYDRVPRRTRTHARDARTRARVPLLLFCFAFLLVFFLFRLIVVKRQTEGWEGSLYRLFFVNRRMEGEGEGIPRHRRCERWSRRVGGLKRVRHGQRVQRSVYYFLLFLPWQKATELQQSVV